MTHASRIAAILFVPALSMALAGCVGAAEGDSPLATGASELTRAEGAAPTEASDTSASDAPAATEATTCWNPFATPSTVQDARVGDEVRYVVGTNLFECLGGVTAQVIVPSVSAGGSARVVDIPGFPNAKEVIVRVLPTGPQTITFNACVSARLNVFPHTSWGTPCYTRQIRVTEPRPMATIAATPTTLNLGPGQLGTTTINWSTAGSTAVDVRVSVDGAPSSLFAAGVSGTQRATWIQPGHTYDFTVHARGQTTAPMASVTVRGVLAVDTLNASPTVVRVPVGALGSTLLSWNAATTTAADVRVSHNGAPSTLFASGGRTGSQTAPWIQAGHSYRFTLHPSGNASTALATVLVQGTAQ